MSLSTKNEVQGLAPKRIYAIGPSNEAYNEMQCGVTLLNPCKEAHI